MCSNCIQGENLQLDKGKHSILIAQDGHRVILAGLREYTTLNYIAYLITLPKLVYNVLRNIKRYGDPLASDPSVIIPSGKLTDRALSAMPVD